MARQQHIITIEELTYILQEEHNVTLAGGTCLDGTHNKKLYYVFTLDSLTHTPTGWYDVVIWPNQVKRFSGLNEAVAYYNSI